MQILSDCLFQSNLVKPFMQSTEVIAAEIAKQHSPLRTYINIEIH